MSTPTPPFLRRRLGRRLKALRDSARLNLDEAATRLEMSRTSLHRVESGENRPNVHLIKSMMDLYDIADYDLLNQAREALKPQWFRSYGLENAGYVDVETYASRVSEFGGLHIPGLLHTESYVRALLAGSRRKRTKQQIDNDVKVRLIRQERLNSEEDPLELVAIVDESALRREIGGSEVLRRQLGHIVELAALPTVTLQVLPLRNGAHSSMDGGFILLDFPEPNDPELLYIEYPTGVLHIEEADRIREAKLRLDQLRTEALSPAESIALTERIAGELDRR